MREGIYKNRIFIVFSLIFMMLMFGNYLLNRSFVREILIQEQINRLNSSSSKIEKWLENKKSSLQSINFLISKFDSKKDEKTIKDILEKSQEIAKFSSVYAGYENNQTISSRFFQRPANYSPTQRPWYQKTIKTDKIYITKPYLDVGLKTPVISICQRIDNQNPTNGVICGILSFDDLKNEIAEFDAQNGGYLFLMDYEFKILFHPNSELELINSKFKLENFDLKSKENHETSDEILTFKPLLNSDLILVAKTPKKNIYKKINEQFIVNFTIYLISVLLFLLLAFIYGKISKKQENLLEKTKKMLDLFVQHSSKGVAIANSQNEIIFTNKKLNNMLSLKDAPSDRLEILSIFPNHIKDKIQTFIAKKSPQNQYLELHYEIDKRHFQLQISHIFTQSKNYEGMIFVLANITRQHKFNEFKKENERMLFQQTKMAELGQMIAAITHQWMQPLNSLSIFLGNLMQFKKIGKLSDEIFYENITRSLDNIDYLVNTMDIFRNFYKVENEAREFDIKKAILDTIFIVFAKQTKVKFKITCEKNLDTTCYNYINEFKQIIACLVQNSNQALQLSKKAKPKIIISIKSDEKHFKILVLDNGCGIENSHKDRIFTPFISTKNSSGLGLYISKLIANKKCKGNLQLFRDKNPTAFMLKIAKKVD